jgi:hypothetical protein
MVQGRTLCAMGKLAIGLLAVLVCPGGSWAEDKHCWREGRRIVCAHHDNQEWREWQHHHDWRREHRWCHEHPERC